MDIRHAKWAKSHDWYVGARYDGTAGRWYVDVLETGTQKHADGTVTEYSKPLTFHNYQALRAWAGY